MGFFQKFILLIVVSAIHLKTYAADRDVDLLLKLKRLQQEATYDDRFNEIHGDPMDNVLFFLKDESSEKYYTTTTTTTTTEAPETSTVISEGIPMDEDYRRMSDLVFRQSRARIALTSTMRHIMRTIMDGIFG